MKLNFIGEKPTNVVSIWSWKHPELAMYDPNREDELEWAAQQMYQKLSGNNDKTYKPLVRQRPRPQGPFIPRIISK